MFQSIMSLIVSVVCLLGGLFMFTFGMSNFGTPYFSWGPTLLGLVLVVYNAFVLYTTFTKKNTQDTRKASVPPTQTPNTQMPPMQTPTMRTPATPTPTTSPSAAQVAWSSQAGDASAVQSYYNSLTPEAVNYVLYGDRANASAVIAEVMPTLLPGASPNDVNAVKVAFKFYIDVWVRKHGGFSPEFMTTEYVKSVLTEKYSHLDAGVVSAAVDRCVAFIYQREPELQQRDQVLAFQRELVRSNAVKNVRVETAHQGDADYGLVPDKPVFVAGFPGLHAYLQSLYLSNGVQPAFNRRGSLNIQGIEGPVDAYDVMVGDKVLTHIFLCIYGNANSTRAPRGFVLR